MRAMHGGDLDAVAAIEAEAYEFPWTFGIFRDCLRAGYECWVLHQGEEVIGYGILSIGAGEAHLLNHVRDVIGDVSEALECAFLGRSEATEVPNA